MRIWLRVVGVLCLLTAVLFAYHLLASGFFHQLYKSLSARDAFPGAILIVLVALFSLSFAVARNIEISEGTARQLVRLRHGRGDGEDPMPAVWQASVLQDWLWLMGILCLLPVPVLGHYIWSEVTFAAWTEMGIAGICAIGLVAASSLSFGAARGLTAAATAARLLPAAEEEEGSGHEGSRYLPHRRSDISRIQYWLRVVGGLCLLPGPLIAYHVLSDPWLYEFYHPRWGWADLTFVGTIVLGLATLSSLSFAEAKELDVLQDLADRLPPVEPGGCPRKTSGGLYVVGVLCLALAPVLMFEGLTWIGDALLGGLLRALTQVLALVTLCCLLFAAAKTQAMLAGIRARVADSQSLQEVDEGTAMPAEGKAAAAMLIAGDRRLRPRRLVLLAVALIAVTAAAVASYRLDPMHAYAHMNRGAALAELGRYEEGLQEFERAARLEPDAAWPQANRGWALGKLGRYEEALTALERATELDPDSAPAHETKGWVLGELGRYDEAMTALHRANELDPRRAGVHCCMGVVLCSVDRYEEALASLGRAIELGADATYLHSNRGWALGKLGRYEEALTALERAMELDPDRVEVHCCRGWMLGELERHEEALGAYDRAIELEPEDAQAHAGRGRALAELGRRDEALQACNRAIELDPSDAWSLYATACVHSLLGNRDDALRDLAKAIELDGDLRGEAQADDDFKSLHGDPEFRELVGTGEEKQG